ncbi:hypothetical protein [Mesorhizobium mediterraneum]|uniref:hypothetical protein n=1 Tax=Mesorhizobium mediterraneum TaxID=43617 RepID=UPI001FEF514E|nr:hypothetical protein [Mesorhizobium mediterraneum]
MAEFKRTGRQSLSLLDGQDAWLTIGHGNDDGDQVRADGLASFVPSGLLRRLCCRVLHWGLMKFRLSSRSRRINASEG